MAIVIRAFGHVATQLRVPRVVATPHLMGHTVGRVGGRTRQRKVVDATLDLLATARQPETLLALD